MASYWTGPNPKRCELCNAALKLLFIHGKTIWGSRKVFCPKCLDDCGCGIGPKRGELYLKVGGGSVGKRGGWKKIAD